MLTRQQAKQHLKTLGWSYRRVAPKLGVGFEHLARVLNGHRESRSLLRKIADLSPSPTNSRSNRRSFLLETQAERQAA